ncbi:MAG: hypothetical protein ACREE9_02485, partial [Stellaceae bacterium]
MVAAIGLPGRMTSAQSNGGAAAGLPAAPNFESGMTPPGQTGAVPVPPQAAPPAPTPPAPSRL